jgi:hypothetical protein
LVARAREYVGVYRFNQYAHGTVAKLLALEWQDLPKVTAPGDGTLEVFFTGAPDEEPHKYVETGPQLFTLVNHQEAGSRHLTFLRNDAGQIVGFSFDSQFFFERVPWYGRIGLHKTLFVLFGGLFVISAAVAALSLRWTREGRGALAVAVLYGLLNLLALVALVAIMRLDAEQERQLFAVSVNPLPAVVVSTIFLLTSVLALLALLLTVRLWGAGVWGARGRALYSGFALLVLAFIPMLHYWNLLGFRW